MQGDSGHSQINMVTDVYSHIIDDDRRKNAELFEEAFYEKKDLDPSMHAHAAGKTVELPTDVDAELLAKVLSNPEMAAREENNFFKYPLGIEINLKGIFLLSDIQGRMYYSLS